MFYYGLNKSFRGLEKVDVQQFSSGLMQGYQSAIESLVKPEEGTIITVMRDVSNALSNKNNNIEPNLLMILKDIFESEGMDGLKQYLMDNVEFKIL